MTAAGIDAKDVLRNPSVAVAHSMGPLLYMAYIRHVSPPRHTHIKWFSCVEFIFIRAYKHHIIYIYIRCARIFCLFDNVP